MSRVGDDDARSTEAAGDAAPVQPTSAAAGAVYGGSATAVPGGAGASARERAAELRARAEAARAVAAELDRQAGAWEAGADGERVVAGALDALSPWGRVLHDRLLKPGRSAVNLDHVVICPAGVYLVDAKNWAGTITVYDGGLWQHKRTGGERTSTPLNREIDKANRMAAQMERVLNTPVEPVLCLAAQSSAGFTPQRVRGVTVVPVGQVGRWLTSQPTMVPPSDAARLAVAANSAFPEATTAANHRRPPGSPTAGNQTRTVTLRGSVAARRGAAQGATQGRRRTQQGRRRPGPLEALARAAAVLVLMWGFVHVWPSLVHAAAVHSTAAMPGATTLHAAPRPCTALTGTVIARLVGHRVYAGNASLHDYCNWYFQPPAATFTMPDVTVITGYAAHAASVGGRTATVSSYLGTATITVPQFSAVPGSPVPATRVTQPVVITYRYSPPSIPLTASAAVATKIRATATNKAAKTVTALAAELAAHLPQGPGSTDVTLHL